MSDRVAPHSFHIPVMGTGFTIDSPLRIARFGISSVVSIGDDILIETMRKIHSDKAGLPFKAISKNEPDSRANRITAYLDLLDDLVTAQITTVKTESFEPGTDITRYFELLPDSALKLAYERMLATTDEATRKGLQDELRRHIVPGAIDVNIMTKVDGTAYREETDLPPEFGVAKSSLRGFARSKLRSSVVFSAGMNRPLFAYLEKFDDFFPHGDEAPRKGITLKVSDFRSAQIQSRLLAKKGLWVSEYRIESGLNCGGHAFATKGHLMGPILAEFVSEKESTIKQLHATYCKALDARDLATPAEPPSVRITVQGGISTADEDTFLREYYKVDSTGWGTPFLLVPEVTNVDASHLEKLAEASDRDVWLSHSSPLGVPFWLLRTSLSEETRLKRIKDGKPGSPCPKGFLASSTEFTEKALCPASRGYQSRRLKALKEDDLAPAGFYRKAQEVMERVCLCEDLAANALSRHGVEGEFNSAICCGPSIAHYSTVTTLEQMLDHIYGRQALPMSPGRPHMFITELRLYIEMLREQLDGDEADTDRIRKYLSDFGQNMILGIEYYGRLAEELSPEARVKFLRDLAGAGKELNALIGEKPSDGATPSGSTKQRRAL
ncbi:MAG: hypothetical protein KOO62_05960 [candidate division Zixibacteria bacterium]|nr:hypothetical protein [candidate division Zixibacteria bacterium]